MKLGSLFDGIGGWPYVASLYGVEPVWASEIASIPASITHLHFPNMVQLGDITKIDGAAIEPVDIMSGSPPCQDVSIAGERKGMLHESNGDDETTRSGMFFEMIRIIKEMRAATNNEYPKVCLYENVTGVFTSHKGEDFRRVIEEFCRCADGAVTIPKAKWGNAGLIVGDGFSFGWRVLDAMCWGVPQRRRRVYAVLDFRGDGAAEILFEPEGMRRNHPSRPAPWESFAANVARCTGGSDGYRKVAYGIGNGQANQGFAKEEHVGALNCMHDQQAVVIALDRPSFNQGIYAQFDMGISDCGAAFTVVAKGPGAVCYDARGNGGGQIAPTMTGDHNRRVTDYTTIVANTSQVRRITPKESERLQGFEDNWTAVDANGRAVADTNRYKCLGNSVALPCVNYVIAGAVDYLERKNNENN